MTKAVDLQELAAVLFRWKVAISVFHGIAIVCTAFRFWCRQRIGRLWWDDYTLIITFIMELAMLTTLWVTTAQKNAEAIALYLLGTVSLIFLLWSTRICLALSIARIYPAGEKHRRLAFGLVILFAIMGISIGSSHLGTCASYAIKYASDPTKPICILDRSLLIVTIAGEITSDILLVAFPLFALWRVKLPKNQRRLILIVFSAGICTILVIVSYILLIFTPLAKNPKGFIALSIMPHLQASSASVSVIVCNFSVVVTFVYRTFFNRPAYHVNLSSAAGSTASLTRASSASSYTESVASQHPTWSDGIMTQSATMAQDPSSDVLTSISTSSYPYTASRTSGGSGSEVVDRGIQTMDFDASRSVGAMV